MTVDFLNGEEFIENAYLGGILDRLRDTPYHYVVTSVFHGRPPRVGKDVVAFVTSSELYYMPDWRHEVLAVFQNYVRADRVDNVFPIPLGYNKRLPAVARVPFWERELDLAFVGQEFDHRQAAIAQMEACGGLGLRVLSKWRCGFANGPPEEYAAALAQTRVSVCPRGYSPETFRLFESLRYGCVVLSDVLPDNRIYRGSPIRQLASWSALPSLAAALFGGETGRRELERASADAVAWWDDVCSEDAVARFVRERLAELAS